MSNTNNNEVEINKTEISEIEKERQLNLIRQQVAMLMDELKRVFLPEMKLTFIARHINDETCYTFLSEENSNDALIKLLLTMKAPDIVVREGSTNASH